MESKTKLDPIDSHCWTKMHSFFFCSTKESHTGFHGGHEGK